MKKRLLFSLFLLSNSVLLYEILVVRIFSVFYLSNYLFLIFSSALLGIGVGGIIAYYLPTYLNRPGPIVFFVYPFSIALYLAYITNYYYFLPAEVNALITSLPLIFAGYIISSFYRLWVKEANQAFFYDLLGGAIGCLLSLPLVKYFGFSNSLLVLVLIGAFAPMLFYWKEEQKFLTILIGFGLVLILILFYFFNKTLNIGINSLRKAKTPIGWMLNYERMQSKLIDTRWDIYSRVDLLEMEGDPLSKTIYINGGTEAVMLKDIHDKQKELLKQNNNLLFFPYKFDKNRNVLVLGAGGGSDVHRALLAGAEHVTAVEINQGVVDLVNKYKEFNGNIFSRPEVEVIVEDARTFIMRDKRKYDRIVLSLASTYAFSELSSISQLENYLYTKEAFNYYFDHLNPDGTLTILIDFEELRDKFIITALSYFEDHSISPFKGMTHIVTVSDPEIYFIGYSHAIVIKKSPYKISEIDKIKEYADTAEFQSDIMPYREYSEKYHPLAAGNINLEDFKIKDNNNLQVPTDDNPYFLEVIMNFRYRLIFFALCIALAIFIFWAFYYQHLLLRVLLDKDNEINISLKHFRLLVPYFTLLGIGSMMIEIVLTKIFSYYLGFPQLNMAIILFGFLAGMGIGSLWAKRFKTGIYKTISFSCLMVSAFLLIIIFTNKYFLSYTIAFPLLLRIILVIIYLFPITFLLGIPFPTAIRTLENKLDFDVPWMWGINGVSAILGSVLSVVLAMIIGIRLVLLLCAIIYLCIAFLAYFLEQRGFSYGR